MGDIYSRRNRQIIQLHTNVYGIADDILIAGFDEWDKDHDEILEKVPWKCRQANLKLNKDTFPFTHVSILFFGKITSQQGASLDPNKIQALKDMQPLKMKKELKSFLDILSYQICSHQQLQSV